MSACRFLGENIQQHYALSVAPINRRQRNSSATAPHSCVCLARRAYPTGGWHLAFIALSLAVQQLLSCLPSY